LITILPRSIGCGSGISQHFFHAANGLFFDYRAEIAPFEGLAECAGFLHST
jgi:hypothetical protein